MKENRTLIKCECKRCKKEILRAQNDYKKSLNRGKNIFCTNSCAVMYRHETKMLTNLAYAKQELPIKENEIRVLLDTSSKRRKHVSVKCKNCDVLFFKPSKFVNNSLNNFCSRDCGKIYRMNNSVTKEEISCDFCGKLFFFLKSRNKNNKHSFRFCCRKCKDDAQAYSGVREIKEAFYGNTNGVNAHRLILKAVMEFTECTKCGYSLHPEILQVHHKDRNRNNNEVDNLELLCPNCHTWEHYLGKDGLYNRRK